MIDAVALFFIPDARYRYLQFAPVVVVASVHCRRIDFIGFSHGRERTDRSGGTCIADARALIADRISMGDSAAGRFLRFHARGMFRKLRPHRRVLENFLFRLLDYFLFRARGGGGPGFPSVITRRDV